MRVRFRLRARMLRRLRQAESGAMAIFIALTTCFVVIPLGALAVDIGMQRVSRVDAQAVADTTALDVARSLASGAVASDSTATTAANASAARSSGAIGKGVGVLAYLGTLSNTFVSDQSLGCDGTTLSNAYFTHTSVNPTAVLVTVGNSVDFAIHGGSGGVCRSSIAQATPATAGTPGTAATAEQACMTIDSYAAQLKSNDSSVLGPLTQLLHTTIDTAALSSSGILTTNLNIADFLVALNLGTTSQVLNSQVTAAQVIAAEVTALTKEGNSSVGATLAQQLGVAASTNSTGKFYVEDLLGVTSGGGSALSGTVNPLDLASAGVILANGTNALTVSATSTNLTGLSANVTGISGPKLVCEGGGTKSVGQVTVNATFSINGGITGALASTVTGLQSLLNGVLSGLGTLLTGESYGTPVVSVGMVTANVSLASASGSVTQLNGCPSPTSMSVTEQASLAPATVSVPITITESHTYKPSILAQPVTEYATSTLTLTLTTGNQSTTTTATLTLPPGFPTPPATGTAQSGPAGNLSLGSAQATTNLTGSDGTFPSNSKALLGTMLGGLNTVITRVTSNLVTPLENNALNPLFGVLTTTLQNFVGLKIAGSTYTPTTGACAMAATAGSPATAASQPKLVG